MDGIHALGGDHLSMEKLQELLLSLGTLGSFLPPPPPAGVLPPPQDHDWLLPLSYIIIAFFSLVGFLSYVVVRCSKCKAGAPEGEVLTMDHECAIATLILVLLVLFSFGSFYYYYCFRAGCFGKGGKAMTKIATTTGRKLLEMSR